MFVECNKRFYKSKLNIPVHWMIIVLEEAARCTPHSSFQVNAIDFIIRADAGMAEKFSIRQLSATENLNYTALQFFI
jgi:hypothetical protein